LCDYLNQY